MIVIFFLMACSQHAEGLKIKAVKDTTICNIPMVLVPAGPYKKGLTCESDAIAYDFWIGKYEITNRQFAEFLKAALSKRFIYVKDSSAYYNYVGSNIVPAAAYRVRQFDNEILFHNDTVYFDPGLADHPAVNVTWFGAKAFCDFYGFDLPQESEWEKAARGNNNYWFPWGNNIDSTYANYYNSGDPFEPGTTPVGFYSGQKFKDFQTSDAVSPYGCYDMAGNAWEWTSDYWTPTTPYNKGKGGGFAYHTPAFLQVYYVSAFGTSTAPPLDMCHLSDGFRVVRRMR